MNPRDILATHCAVCSRRDGEECPNGRVALREIELLSRFEVRREDESTIVLCTYCLSAVPFDIDGLMRQCNEARERTVASGVVLKGVVERYIRDVWPDDEPPSYQHLVELVNAVGIRPPNARIWTYHNLKQKLDSLGVDRQTCLTERPASVYADRLDELKAMSAAWLDVRLKKEGPALPNSVVGVELERLPADMPGAV